MRLINVKAQASLEYLLVFAAAVSFLAVFFVAGTNLVNAGVFFLEAKNAEEFMDSFETALKEVSVFSAGTAKEMSFSSGNDFDLISSKNKVELILYGKEKTKSFEFNPGIDVMDFSFSGKEINLLLINERNHVSVKNS
ncbi:MAG: hypothetical protein ABIA76_03715 [Candidatus Diapherotrites archaeon]